jgi:nucleoid-associated protein YgaU
MKKVMFAFILSSFLLSGAAFGQAKKLTKTEADNLLQECQTKESELRAKIDEEQSAISALKGDIANLRSQVQALENQIAELKKPKYDIYVVKDGDTLSKIAHEVYGKSNRWKDVYEANRDVIKNPEFIYPGWKLKIPRP